MSNDDGVSCIQKQLQGMKRYEHLIHDDIQRIAYDNWTSGVRWACAKLGVNLDES